MWVDGRFMSEPEVAAYIDKLNKENNELKRYLKLAVEDTKQLLENNTCLADCIMCEKDVRSCNGCCEPRWRYAVEVETLINDKSETNPNLEYTGSIT